MNLTRFVRLSVVLCILATASPHSLGAELPKRKAGLWEIQTRPEGAPSSIKSMQCIDEKSDARMLQRAMQGDGAQKCGQPQFNKTATGYVTDHSCTTERGTKMSWHVEITGDFNNAYTMDINAHFEPPLHGRSDMRQKAEFQYKGACPADMKPGDMSVNGIKFNPESFSGPNGLKGGKLNPEDLKKMLEQLRKQGRP